MRSDERETRIKKIRERAKEIRAEAAEIRNPKIRASMLNIARMAWFSSDRAIGEYARDIWDVPFETPAEALRGKR